jgi:hypothetical protein
MGISTTPPASTSLADALFPKVRQRVLAELFGALESATVALGRKVNPTLYAPAEWSKRISQDSAFVTRVIQQPKIWLIGTEEQLHAPSA